MDSLEVFELTRADLGNEKMGTGAVRTVASRLPTYVTLEDVKGDYSRKSIKEFQDADSRGFPLIGPECEICVRSFAAIHATNRL